LLPAAIPNNEADGLFFNRAGRREATISTSSITALFVLAWRNLSVRPVAPEVAPLLGILAAGLPSATRMEGAQRYCASGCTGLAGGTRTTLCEDSVEIF